MTDYVYRIYYSWFETYVPREYISNVEYTEDELKALADEILIRSIDTLLAKEGFIGFNELIKLFIENLPDHFRPLKYQARYGLFGCCIIDDPNDEDLKEIPAEIHERIIAHNKIVNDAMEKRLEAESK